MSVYFARVGRYTKVGYSKNPIARSTTITTTGQRPDDVPRGAEANLIGWVPGGRARESWFHRTFADSRVAGEWFVLDESAVRDLIRDDPRGVDFHGMSAMAVFTMSRNPEVTRDDLAAAGIQVEAVSFEEGMWRMSAAFREVWEATT